MNVLYYMNKYYKLLINSYILGFSNNYNYQKYDCVKVVTMDV